MTDQETIEESPVGNPTPEQETVEQVIPEVSPEPEPETFPAAYVQKLRQEAADARVKAKRTDDLATRLHTALVAATGRLADPTDMPFDDAHLEDDTALTDALDALLKAKPHLASRRPRGDVGQGQSGGSGTFDLAGMLRQRAG